MYSLRPNRAVPPNDPGPRRLWSWDPSRPRPAPLLHEGGTFATLPWDLPRRLCLDGSPAQLPLRGLQLLVILVAIIVSAFIGGHAPPLLWIGCAVGGPAFSVAGWQAWRRGWKLIRR